MWDKFKNWLKKSGYFVAKPDTQSSKTDEIEDELNPLMALYSPDPTPVTVKTPLAPHKKHLRRGWARIYFDSFWTGHEDTFRILLGVHYPYHPEQKGRKGVLDLLIFPLISRRLYSIYQQPDSRALRIAFAVLTAPIFALFEFARYALAALLTLALVPVVALVHLSAGIHAYILEKKAEQLKVRQVQSLSLSDSMVQLSATTIGSMLKAYENKDVKAIHLPSYQQRPPQPKEWQFKSPATIKGNFQFTLFSPEKYNKKPEQKAALEAFLWVNDEVRNLCEDEPTSPFVTAYRGS